MYTSHKDTVGISWYLKTKNVSESSEQGEMPHHWKAQRSSWRKWNGGTEACGGFGCTKRDIGGSGD